MEQSLFQVDTATNKFFFAFHISKAKVWRVVLEAVGLLMIEYLFMVLAGLALVYYDLIPLA